MNDETGGLARKKEKKPWLGDERYGRDSCAPGDPPSSTFHTAFIEPPTLDLAAY